MSYFFSMLLPLQVAVLSSPGPLLPGHLLLISELASSQWDPGRGPKGPAEWRGEGVLGSLYGCGLYKVSGTGCKLLCIALGQADAYVLSDGTTSPPSLGTPVATMSCFWPWVKLWWSWGSLALLCGEGQGYPSVSSGSLPTSSPPPTGKQSPSQSFDLPLKCRSEFSPFSGSSLH